jgi:histone acetyltransferase (RNA polymerase elongator complex component)
VKIIPIFIPHSGCPYRCVYCDQRKISGTLKAPGPEEINPIIERNLKTIPENERIELAFFGGTFTLLPIALQKKYLDAAYPYVKTNKIAGIRMSTHPEAVSKDNMSLFKKKGGCLVELGIQSLDRDVLSKSGRPMKLRTVENAVRRIKDARLELGVQVMLGLPGDTLEKSVKTAEVLVKFKPKTARIYPTLVIKGTALAELYKKSKYKPQ